MSYYAIFSDRFNRHEAWERYEMERQKQEAEEAEKEKEILRLKKQLHLERLIFRLIYTSSDIPETDLRTAEIIAKNILKFGEEE